MDTTNSRSMEMEETTTTTFDMDSLPTHLPQKRKGLSKYFTGKMQSFTCLDDAKSIEDLQKAEIPKAKKRKYSNRQAAALLPTDSCRNESGSS